MSCHDDPGLGNGHIGPIFLDLRPIDFALSSLSLSLTPTFPPSHSPPCSCSSSYFDPLLTHAHAHAFNPFLASRSLLPTPASITSLLLAPAPTSIASLFIAPTIASITPSLLAHAPTPTPTPCSYNYFDPLLTLCSCVCFDTLLTSALDLAPASIPSSILATHVSASFPSQSSLSLLRLLQSPSRSCSYPCFIYRDLGF